MEKQFLFRIISRLKISNNVTVKKKRKEFYTTENSLTLFQINQLV